MLDFFTKYLDIVYLFYGLSFMIMGVFIFSQLKIILKSEFKLLELLWLLAWFGTIHGINEFIDMFVVIHGEVVIFEILRPLFLVTSYFFLFCFGYQLINSGKKKMLSVQVGVGVVAAFLTALLIMGITSEVAWLNSGRYFLGFTGGLMSAIGFFLYYRNNYKELNKLHVKKYFVLAASFLCIYAIIGGLIVRKSNFFPASVVNFETFHSFVRIPVQIFRAICALGITFSVWNIMGIFDAEELLRRRKTEDAKCLSEIGALVITIAHELRNPLAAIGMAVYNIRRKIKNPDIDKHLSNIDKKVVESDQIINNLLLYSQLKPPNYERVNIFDIIEECDETSNNQSKKEIRVIKNMDSIKDLLIEADPIQIEEVFSNILNNAYDAVLPDKGEIKIISENYADLVKITIKDNGIGIDKSNLDKIFDPFFTTKAKGTGLGLSVCRQIVKMHGGEIGVESESGKGTSISVILPKKEKNKRSLNP